ncbi:hypothetical protein PHLCEN_2v8121 [Hermanssonia centrifuga]|uniref:DnaJ homologue subfamily C member 28 conserved domain-containing protein n=1 Tax=Hermanssonia centrifuga TaxID=98765 RepID=A0A2R6NUK2_9APHY|nr:hypothetical protein PHLCEN_2v8121 [Hermanssonia centrifuga]
MISNRAAHIVKYPRIPSSVLLKYRSYSENATEPDHRASSQLFQDAANEEAELAEKAARSSRLAAMETKHENWTGEETMQDAVLRMLVDKYKPLRSGPVRTAEEKLKQNPPKIGTQIPVKDTSVNTDAFVELTTEVRTTWGASTSRSMAEVPLLPSIEGHQPWHTTFRVPSHAQSSIKYGHIPPSSTSRPLPASALDDKARRKEREAKKRTEHAGRIHNAKESTLDYRLGIKGSKHGASVAGRRPVPVNLKGWATLVEDRIERARQEGRFDSLKGRGKPLEQFVEERNPFIAREEFLLNRIVQRNGAAPPWVELQGGQPHSQCSHTASHFLKRIIIELETAINTLRDIMRQSWIRRAIRMLTLSRPAALLPKLTLEDVMSLRDPEWEIRERAYHDIALEEVNSLVRKHNGLAPYAVRRPHYMLSVELEKVYRESGEDILKGIAERVNPRAGSLGREQGLNWDEEETSAVGGSTSLAPLRIRDVVRQWIGKLVGR